MRLHLGKLFEWDTTYFNGEKIDSLGTPFVANEKTHHYWIPRQHVQAGQTNCLGISLWGNSPQVRMIGPAEDMYLQALEPLWYYPDYREDYYEIATARLVLITGSMVLTIAVLLLLRPVNLSAERNDTRSQQVDGSAWASGVAENPSEDSECHLATITSPERSLPENACLSDDYRRHDRLIAVRWQTDSAWPWRNTPIPDMTTTTSNLPNSPLAQPVRYRSCQHRRHLVRTAPKRTGIRERCRIILADRIVSRG